MKTLNKIDKILFLEELLDKLEQAECLEQKAAKIEYIKSLLKGLKRPTKGSTKKEEASALYQKFMTHYFEQYESLVGTKPSISVYEGKALKSIIERLRVASIDKTEDGALKAWKYIWHKWSILPPFVQRQKNLSAVNRHLGEILDVLKQGGVSQSSAKVNELEALKRKFKNV